MRALIVDDQREFFESIRPTLKKAGFVPEYAPDMPSAQRNLTERNFDLVLTDLQMPPGNWGGLDIIKMVRQLDVVVPLFVVSGKGSLAECIQARRLGADDYIQKEVFATEFVELVQPRFAHPYAIEHFPSLIAYLFRLFEEEQQEQAKAKRLLDVYETTMRLLSLMIMAEQFPKAESPVPSLLKEWKMQKPSLGHYESFVFDSINGKWDGSLLNALRASDFAHRRQDCSSLTHCRNQISHSTLISQHRAAEIVRDFSKVLICLLNAVSCLRRFRLFLALTLENHGTSWAANGKLLQGSNLHHPTATMVLKDPPLTRHVTIITDTAVIADVGVLIEVVMSQKGDWDVYKVYNKLDENGIVFELIPN